VLCQVIKYKHRLTIQEEGSLLFNARLEQETMGQVVKTKTWMTMANNIAQYYNLEHILLADRLGKSQTKLILTSIGKAYRDHWLCSIRNSPKLECYAEIKPDLYYEPYLDYIKDREKQIALTKLRVSKHELEIEKGRYTKPKTERSLRVCKLCSTGMVEDEAHFLLQCPTYQTERSNLFMTTDLNLQRLLHCYTQQSIGRTANFIVACNFKRKQLLTQNQGQTITYPTGSFTE